MMLWPYIPFSEFDLLDDGRVRFYRDEEVLEERYFTDDEFGYYSDANDYYLVCFAQHDEDDIINFILKQPNPIVASRIIESHFEHVGSPILHAMANMVYYNELFTTGSEHPHYSTLLSLMTPHIMEEPSNYKVEVRCHFIHHGIPIPITHDVLLYSIEHGISIGNDINQDVEECTLYL